jgi:hypothetical protein
MVHKDSEGCETTTATTTKPIRDGPQLHRNNRYCVSGNHNRNFQYGQVSI